MTGSVIRFWRSNRRLFRCLPPDEQHKGRRETVRKDLVIWPRPGMTLWEKRLPQNEPVAVMEWKVNHFLNCHDHSKNRREHVLDIQWLLETSARSDMADFIGYAVMVHTQVPPVLTCVKAQGGLTHLLFASVSGSLKNWLS